MQPKRVGADAHRSDLTETRGQMDLRGGILRAAYHQIAVVVHMTVCVVNSFAEACHCLLSHLTSVSFTHKVKTNLQFQL